jgi:hypothetical protein
MKGILEFDLNDPDDKVEFQLTSHARGWVNAMWDLDQWLRGKVKYGHTYKTADEALEATRAMLFEQLSGHGVSLEDVE